MNVLKLYLAFRLPAAFILSFFLFGASSQTPVEKLIKKASLKLQKSLSQFSLFLVLGIIFFVLPQGIFYAIYRVSRHFYIPYIAYAGFALDILLASQIILLQEAMKTAKNASISDNIEDSCILSCKNSIVTMIIYAAAGSPAALFYTAVSFVTKKSFFIRTIINTIMFPLTSYLTMIVVFIFSPLFRPLEMVKIFFRDNLRRPEGIGTLVAVYSGALGIIAGGKLNEISEEESEYKSLIGDKIKEADLRDLKKAKFLFFMTNLIVLVCATVTILSILF